MGRARWTTGRRARLAFLSIAAALFIHGAIYALYLRFAAFPPRRPISLPSRPITSTDSDRTAVRESRLQRERVDHKSPQATTPKQEPKTGQIVEIAQPAARKPPAKAAFLAEHDAVTEHETRSRHQSSRFDAMASRPQPDAVAETLARRAELPSGRAQESTARLPPKAQPQPAPGAKRLLRAESESLQAPPPRRALRAEALMGPTGLPEAKGPVRPLTLDDLIPGLDKLTTPGAGGPTNDALNDMDVGEETRLNAQQFRYAGFFNRLKRSVGGHWQALREYERRDPTGNIYGVRSRETLLDVTLAQDGALREVTVAQSSGVEFLDRAALQAFRDGQPFANPPRGLVSADGTIRFQFLFQIHLRDSPF